MATWRAYAKINLCLEVLGRRRDGYHEVLTILQTVDLYDTLAFEPADDLTLTCSDRRLEGEGNLVLRAARLLQRAAGVDRGATIHLEKRIPTAAGLGGGSSDAAVTLLALSSLWGLRMTRSNLENLATALGADVPFFLYGGTALAEGRGDRLSPLPALAEHWVVLVCPPLEIPDKTSLMYASLTPREYTSGAVTRHMARAIQEGQEIRPGLIFNTFEWVAFRNFELLEATRQRVVEAGADHVRLCGAGPALYALYREETPARALYERLCSEGLDVLLVRTVEGKPAPLP
ncbi:MAG: 4-(cytidine 5'-diphospho)-2-C-methyl-D-erythritol kinase [Chloroflexia bacterium]